MALNLGDTFPDFDVDTTIGRINFYDWLGGRYDMNFLLPMRI